MITRIQNSLIYQMNGETIRIDPWGKNSLRVRATYQQDFPQENWALLPLDTADEVQIHIQGKRATVSHGDITAVIGEGGDLRFFNKSGKCFLKEQWRDRGELDGHGLYDVTSALCLRGREFKPIRGGDYQLTVRFEPNEGEKIFGMGQYQDGCLDKKGTALELAQRNSQASVPFFLSNLGYGMLWNNPAIGKVVFAKNTTEWTADSTKAMDYWITVGDTPATIEAQYMTAVGKAPMMPDYAMGFWQCKLRYRTQDELLNVAREYNKRNIPLSVIVSDFFHWPYQGDWCFDPREWPDPKRMVDELKEMGVELMVSIWPYVDTRSIHYQQMKEEGLLVNVERGVPVSMLFCGNTLPFDATNPRAREFVWNTVRKNYYDMGIRLFWLDEAEPECAVYDFDNYRYAMGSVLQVGNIYPVLYTKAFYEGLKSQGEDLPIELVRCAWAGSAKYGALVWSGDIGTTFDTLRSQLAAGLSMAIAGIPWWTTDIGGFHGGNQHDPDYIELILRWFQFATFCPVLRLHGCRENGEPSVVQDKPQSGGPNEIWSYGEEAYEIMKAHIEMRQKMRPYIRRAMRCAAEEGIPPMRPIWFDFPEDEKAWHVEDAYLFGEGMLIAPMLEAKKRNRRVYLPAGCQWTEIFSQKTYAGGQWIEADAPLWHIPCFVRNGVLLYEDVGSIAE